MSRADRLRKAWRKACSQRTEPWSEPTPTIMEKKIWSTSDIYIAATLKTLGAVFKGVTLDGMQRWQFNFEDSEDIQKAVQLYYDKELAVEPSSLFLSMRTLRREAHELNSSRWKEDV
jgi:hypothetical protein